MDRPDGMDMPTRNQHDQPSKADGRSEEPERSRWAEIGFAFCYAINRMKLEEAGFTFGGTPRHPGGTDQP